MVPVHTWLSDAVEEETPGASVLLVSDPGQDRHLRDDAVLPRALPEASRWATPVVLVLAVVSVLYGGWSPSTSAASRA